MHFMPDLETWGNAPGCAISAIAVVPFDEEGLRTPFYRRIDLQSCMDAGLTVNASTIEWWMRQSDEARAEQVAPESRIPLRQALDELDDFFFGWEQLKSRRIMWGNDPSFDNAVLGIAYDVLGLERPWQFRNNRCYRTIKECFPCISEPAREGTHHKALDDATHQARHVLDILTSPVYRLTRKVEAFDTRPRFGFQTDPPKTQPSPPATPTIHVRDGNPFLSDARLAGTLPRPSTERELHSLRYMRAHGPDAPPPL